jgi:hypothetical protein
LRISLWREIGIYHGTKHPDGWRGLSRHDVTRFN